MDQNNFFYSLPNEQHCHMILMDDLVENQPTTVKVGIACATDETKPLV